MDEEGKRNRFWDWMEGNAVGRKALAVMAWLSDRYHRHVDRYYDRSQTRYRCYTWLVATAAVLVVLATMNGAFKVGVHYYRYYQESHLQKESQSFMTHGDYNNAALSA